MKKTTNSLQWIFTSLVLAIIFISHSSQAQTEPLVNIQGYAQHVGNRVIYYYQVINKTPYEIPRIWIGYDNKNDNDRNNDELELNEFPAGWAVAEEISPGGASSPLGWMVRVIQQEDNETTHALSWEVQDGNSPRLLPSQTLTGMSVTLDKIDFNYLSKHATVKFSDHAPVAVPIGRLDITPPTLSVSATPAVLWPPNNKMVDIVVNLTVKDDYDPQPEIKLESITSNEGLAASDIAGANFGTDDRQFSLRASRDGANMAGRIYTITYSATDGSGNKSTASATVTVPNDQR